MKDQRLSQEECFEELAFPFYELGNYDEWINRLDDYLLENNSGVSNDALRNLRRHIEKRLRNVWQGFEIPYVILPKTIELAQVSEIFERVNTTGKPLGVFDLLIARLLRHGVELRKLWEEVEGRYDGTIGRYQKRTQEKIKISIFYIISLFHHPTSSCKRKDILNIYENLAVDNPEEFRSLWEDASVALHETIENLEKFRDGFGVKSEKEVPFMPMLPPLSALLKVAREQPQPSLSLGKVRQWYWSSVFSNAYSASADSQMTADYKDVISWFSDDEQIPRVVREARRGVKNLNTLDVTSYSSAIFKGILALLCMEGAHDFVTGRPLEDARENERDHIFPKSGNFGKNIDSILNITWMSRDTNNKIKAAKKPSVYIPELIQEKHGGDEREFVNILKTHFINEKAYGFMKADDFQGFLEERRKEIINKIEELIGYKSSDSPSTLIEPEKPFSNTMLYGELFKKCTDYIDWFDKYFSVKGLEILRDFLEPSSIRTVRILTSKEKIDPKLKTLFKLFRKEMKPKGIRVELRYLDDQKLLNNIHDRWLLTKGRCFNIPSPDVVARGQWSEINETANKPPFDEWWGTAKDVFV